ncbi:MAG: fused response regulator/phosphatase [Pseudomonadota bacterium]
MLTAPPDIPGRGQVPTVAGSTATWRVLVVDDSRAQLRILSRWLQSWGYEVATATSGIEAARRFRDGDIDLVLSDWMMPGMTGPELCELLRGLQRDRYTYFILLSSKNDKAEIARGLEYGADEFLTKPVNAGELRARLTAGTRILQLDQQMTEKNRLLSSMLSELQTLYDSIDRDLIEARHLQQSLVPERAIKYDGADVTLLLRPSGHVGGDLVGAFRVSESRIGMFALDVSGHGITSALLTARLAGHLSGSTPEKNVALMIDDLGLYRMRPTEDILADLNTMMLTELETEHYFTAAIADCNLKTGEVRISQAGHPHPMILRSSGEVDFIGESAMPVGLVEAPIFATYDIQLAPGERLLFYSDGFPECPDPDGAFLEEDGFAASVRSHRALQGEAFLEALVWSLANHAGDENFPDDLSAACFQLSQRKTGA